MAIILIWEGLRYATHELRRSPRTTIGLLFEEFLFNEMVDGTYRGKRRRVVFSFLLATMIKKPNSRIAIPLLQHFSEELPVQELSGEHAIVLRRLAREFSCGDALKHIGESAAPISKQG